MAESLDDIPTGDVKKPSESEKGESVVSDGEDLFGDNVEATNESLPALPKSSAIPRKRTMEALQPVVVDHPYLPTASCAIIARAQEGLTHKLGSSTVSTNGQRFSDLTIEILKK